MSANASLSLLKTLCYEKNVVAFKDIEIGEYLIHEFALVHTTWGARVRLDLGDKAIFLPERFAKMKPEDVEALNSSQKILCYMGKDPARKNKLLIDFKEAVEYAEGISPSNFTDVM